MIEAALRYPLEPGPGRRALVVVTAAVLAVAIGVRAARTLYPLSLALVPLALAGVAALVLCGTLADALVDPDAVLEPAGGTGPERDGVAAVARKTLGSGALAAGIGLGTLALPVALLLGSVYTFADLEADLDPGAPLFLLVASTSALVAFFAAAYALPVLVAGAGRRGLAGAFDGVRLRRVLGDLRYFSAWTVGLPATVLGAGLASFAVGAGGVGGLLVAACGAYLLLVGVHALGAGERAAGGAASSAASASAEE